jgi:hypothetical protein
MSTETTVKRGESMNITAMVTRLQHYKGSVKVQTELTGSNTNIFIPLTKGVSRAQEPSNGP